jgi:hypothetical protein
MRIGAVAGQRPDFEGTGIGGFPCQRRRVPKHILSLGRRQMLGADGKDIRRRKLSFARSGPVERGNSIARTSRSNASRVVAGSRWYLAAMRSIASLIVSGDNKKAAWMLNGQSRPPSVAGRAAPALNIRDQRIASRLLARTSSTSCIASLSDASCNRAEKA